MKFTQEVVELLFIGKLNFSPLADMRTSELIYFGYREMKENRFSIFESCLEFIILDY